MKILIDLCTEICTTSPLLGERRFFVPVVGASLVSLILFSFLLYSLDGALENRVHLVLSSTFSAATLTALHWRVTHADVFGHRMSFGASIAEDKLYPDDLEPVLSFSCRCECGLDLFTLP